MSQYIEESRSATGLDKYRNWLYAAALYNLLWGISVVLFPDTLFRLMRIPTPRDRTLWQCIGMFVMVYAPAYWWAGRYPQKHTHLVAIGFLGKLFGPLGFIWAASRGQLPVVFGLINLTNDLIWLPAFLSYLRAAIRKSGGFRAFLRGDT